MFLKKNLIISAALFVFAAVMVVVVFSTEPTPKREAATKRTAMLVDVIIAEAGDFKPQISAMGTVKAEQDIVLRPRVSGQVISLAEGFVPGNFVRKGDVLLQIDPADYKNALAQRKSELAAVETALKIEMGEQEIAKRDYQRLNQQLSPMQKSLVLREPQLAAAEAKVIAAKAAVNQALQELERTQVRAPFDAQILNRNVNVGSQISPNDMLAQLVGLQKYWIEATVPPAKTRHIQDGEMSQVKVFDRTTWKSNEYRDAKVRGIIGELQGQTRLARILIEISDPLAILKENEGKPRLIIGSYVECAIAAKPFENVVKLPREYVRKRDTAWIMQDDKLSIRELNIVFRDENFAYVSQGIQGGEQVVITALSRVRDGAELRKK